MSSSPPRGLRRVAHASLCVVAALASIASSAPSRAQVRAHLEPQYGRTPIVSGDVVTGGATSWGLVTPDDVRGGWGRVCEESFPPVTFFAYPSADGAVVLGGFDGLSTTRDGGCSDAPIDNELAGRAVSALWVDPQDPAHVMLGTSTPSDVNGVYESDDGGVTVRALIAPEASDFFNLARSGDLVAASGGDRNGRPVLRLSTDAGTTWTDASSLVQDEPLVHALVWHEGSLVVGGFRNDGLGYVAQVIAGASPQRVDLGTVATEVTHAAYVGDTLFVLARLRGEVSRLAPGEAAFVRTSQSTSGGPADCLYASPDGAFLVGCGRQAGLNTSLFVTSSDGAAWTEQIAFRDVHYRVCPEGSIGFSACARYFEQKCGDGLDDDFDAATDCDDDDCFDSPLCTGGEGEGEGGAVAEGEGEGSSVDDGGDGGSARVGCTCEASVAHDDVSGANVRGLVAAAAWGVLAIAPALLRRARRRRS